MHSRTSVKKPKIMPRKLSKPEQRERQLDRQIEKRISFIRKNPRLDKYGRPIPDGSPIGMGDKNWIKNYGIGGYSSVKTPILGVGIPRDSYLPRECRENEKNALRVLRSADEHTPRSTKLTKEIKKWAKKNYLHENNAFMAQLIQVSKRVKPISSLQRPPYNISLENLSELHPLIYKFANYSLQDKRQINAHFGGSTREQMAKAQLFKSMGDPPGMVACEVTYEPKYKAFDKLEPRVPMLMSTREQMTKAQLFKSMGNPGLPSECHPVIPYVPKFSYLSSEPSSVSARFGKPPGSDQNVVPVWKKILSKKIIEKEKYEKKKELARMKKKRLNSLAKKESKNVYDLIDENEKTILLPWKTPVQSDYQADFSNAEDMGKAGSLDKFLLPEMSKKQKTNKVTRIKKITLMERSQSEKYHRYGSQPTPQRYVKNWFKRHEKPVKITVRKPKPEEKAEKACTSHLATIERCQPTEWLSPYGGDDHNQHLHATAGTSNKEWMGDEWLDENEDGSINEEKLLQFGQKEERIHIQNEEEEREEQETTQHDELNLQEQIVEPSELEQPERLVQIESEHPLPNVTSTSDIDTLPERHELSINPIARRSEFFGKCRIANKLAKFASPRRTTNPGRLANRATIAEKHTYPHTPRTAAIVATYKSGVVPRPGSLAEVSQNGVCDLSHRSIHSEILITFLQRVHSAFMTSKSSVPDIQTLLLNDCRLTDRDAAKIIYELTKMQKILHLDLSNNKLGMQTGKALIELTNKTSLFELYLSGTLAHHSHASATLLKGWSTLNLKIVDFSHNRISSIDSVQKIGKLISDTKTLKHLNLSWNNFGPNGGKLIAEAFIKNKTLTYLSLSFNGIGEQATTILSKGIIKHPKILTLDVDGSSFGDASALTLANAMVQSQSKRKNNGSGTFCTVLMRHNKISSQVCQQVIEKNINSTKDKSRLIFEVYPVIVGDGEGSTDPTVSVVYQVPK